jgi:hypothetical protein
MQNLDNPKRKWARQVIILLMIIYTAIEAPLSFALHLEVMDWQ